MSEPAQAQVDENAIDPDDVVSFWEFFGELFVPNMGLALPLKDAHRHAAEILERVVTDDIAGAIEYARANKIDIGLDETAPAEQLAKAIRYVLINIPPRVGKTKMMEALICWLFAYFPDAQAIYTCYAAALAEVSLAYVQKVMRSSWYIDLYGDHIHGKRSDHLSTVEGGNIYAEGTGGTLTGKGGGLKRPAGGCIIIDDPAKPDEALSPVVSEGVRQWFETTIKDRRNSTEYTPIIICAQRLAPLDLPGYVMKEYKDQTIVLKFPGLVNGVSQFPETITTEDLLTYNRTRTGRFVLASKFQQEPVALGGNLIPTDCFPRWHPSTPMKWERTVICVDTALKIKQWNDFSCASLWGLCQSRAYLIDLIHGKWETPELLANSHKFWEKHTTHSSEGFPRPRLIIEEKAAGTPLLQSLRKLGVPATGIERDIDKVRRVQGILAHIETGMVIVPQDGSTNWIEKFLAECAEFAGDGTAAHDDMVDTMVDAIEYLLGKPVSILDVIKSSFAAPEAPGVTVQLRRPMPMPA